MAYGNQTVSKAPNYKLHHAYSKILEINHTEKCHNKSVNSFELKVTYLILQMWDSALPMQGGVWVWSLVRDPTCLVAKTHTHTHTHKIGCNRSESSVSLLTYLNNRGLALGLYSAISTENQQWLKHIKICLSQEQESWTYASQSLKSGSKKLLVKDIFIFSLHVISKYIFIFILLISCYKMASLPLISYPESRVSQMAQR